MLVAPISALSQGDRGSYAYRVRKVAKVTRAAHANHATRMVMAIGSVLLEAKRSENWARA